MNKHIYDPIDKQMGVLREELEYMDVWANFIVETNTQKINGEEKVVKVSATWEIPLDEYYGEEEAREGTLYRRSE